MTFSGSPKTARFIPLSSSDLQFLNVDASVGTVAGARTVAGAGARTGAGAVSKFLSVPVIRATLAASSPFSSRLPR